MRALVVYESMFGCTEAVAFAVAEGLEQLFDVQVVPVGDAPDDLSWGGSSEVALLVVGAPTHAYSLSRLSTRRDAALQADAPLTSPGRGVREWLDGLGPLPGLHAAVFTTVLSSPRLTRHLPSAVTATTGRLRRLGVGVLQPLGSFLVDGVAGPVAAGELERARAWGSSLGHAAHALYAAHDSR